MKTDDLREAYLGFFSQRNHARVTSDSLVPQNDASILFTGAGMNQFKDNFLGINKDLRRATSSQKCLRTGDLERVGHTAFHHSFFEMLGNFSFGDYFKEDAIVWAWEFLTGTLKIPQERLRVTVHRSDEEAFRIWKERVKIRESWIYRLGDHSNFWPANAPADGPNGPCGPCSEIYFDQFPGTDDADIESDRFAEIWNLVFTQFDRRDGGHLNPLSQKNIDTGMGLERLACVMQGKKSNFEIDIFQPIRRAIQRALKSEARPESLSSIDTIADHVRAVAFSIADGVIPSNEGRGYVIRKLIRRAVWHARQIAQDHRLEGGFLGELIPVVAQVMRPAYPELDEAADSIIATVRGEEEKFLGTLENGLKLLEDRMAERVAAAERRLSGEAVFELYDTYGFPDELTRIIAQAKGYEIDQGSFERLMADQKRRAKESTKISSEIFSTGELQRNLAGLPPTVFCGYDEMEAEADVLWANLCNGRGVVVLDRSPFYGESGGQCGDTGILESGESTLRVVDTQKKDGKCIHVVESERGYLKAGDRVIARVDPQSRLQAMRNHTATHLLHAALRRVLGKQVRQLGSLVTAEKLRFDYSYSGAPRPEQLAEIEDAVNERILRDTEVLKTVQTIREAKDSGALAFFGDKYGEKVRVISVGDFSKELCGGTHCDRTGQIGIFIITSDSSIASGTRRIEAVTGDGALNAVREMRDLLTRSAQILKTSPSELPERIARLQDNAKKIEKEMAHRPAHQMDAGQLLLTARTAGGCRCVFFKTADMPVKELRRLSDDIRTRAKGCVYFLATSNENKIQYILAGTLDLEASGVDLRNLGKELDHMLAGKSGGNALMVQGGAAGTGRLEQNWDAVQTAVINSVKGF
jgi:alanyl-tRNA synthetase